MSAAAKARKRGSPSAETRAKISAANIATKKARKEAAMQDTAAADG
jgi:hypothetical protein